MADEKDATKRWEEALKRAKMSKQGEKKEGGMAKAMAFVKKAAGLYGGAGSAKKIDEAMDGR